MLSNGSGNFAVDELVLSCMDRHEHGFGLNNSVFGYIETKRKLEFAASSLVEKYMFNMPDHSGNKHDSDLPEYCYFLLSSYGLILLNV